ncbi:serine hydrolase domain-containing protein [Psychrobacillus sp. BM2]|uniref:serine hydrolase domain-containing protein n=1 Tax=Psychrobacillus sp. BM2 TaxID=3400421 RepID=UPI003B016C46
MKQLEHKLNRITDDINEIISNQQGVGVSVAIVKDSESIYSKGFGYSQIQPVNRSIDGDTLMSIQSISKNFMALSIMQLVEKNLISLNHTVVKYLPYFRTKNKQQSDTITIQHLLSHTAGLPSNLGIANMIAPNVREIFSDTLTEFQEALDYYNLTEEEISSIQTRDDITKWFKKVELEYPVGMGWNYCTDAYVILADLFEKVTGRNWEIFLRDEILIPLNMDRTTSDSQKVEKDMNSAKYYLGEAKMKLLFLKTQSQLLLVTCIQQQMI